MNKKLKVILPVLLTAIVIGAVVIYLRHANIAVLQPRGQVGQKERGLMEFTVLLGLGIIIPVFIMAIAIAYRYREGNPKQVKYTPDWATHRVAETIWWGVPIAIIVVLGVVTWRSTHQLDPYKNLTSSNKPMTIQVVSLDWKWLFIYPDHHIATVNYARIPRNTSVNFEITSDTVMNSFWVPQLGGQIYAMPGMVTHMNLMASQNGNYQGSSANISGSGFAGMKFTVQATSQSDFANWVSTAQQAKKSLTVSAYAALAKPSKNNTVAIYSHAQNELYDMVVMKYMMPMSTHTDSAMLMTGMGL